MLRDRSEDTWTDGQACAATRTPGALPVLATLTAWRAAVTRPLGTEAVRVAASLPLCASYNLLMRLADEWWALDGRRLG